MICGIYKIENLVNHKVYIGQSKNIKLRWSKEKSKAFSKTSNEYNKTLSKAFRKYGIENFSFEILEECSSENLNEKEQYWIKEYNSYLEGYNETIGGEGTLWNGMSLTKEKVEEIQNLLKTTSQTNIEIAKNFNVSENTICGINTGYYWYNSNLKYPIRKPKRKIIEYCLKCGKQLSNSKTGLCSQCYSISSRKVERPVAEELSNILYRKNGNFAEVARMFDVTDNTVRKWCKKYNLPYHSKDYQ